MDSMFYGLAILFVVIIVMKYNKCNESECDKICNKVNAMCHDSCEDAQKENFSSKRPEHAPFGPTEAFTDVKVDGDLDNYQEQIKAMSLEPGVEKSHKEFISGVLKRTSPASNWTVRDDTNDINPSVGLTKARYHIARPKDEILGTTPSESPEQMVRQHHLRW